MNKKEIFKKVILGTLTGIGLFELSKVGFWLMNQPSTIFFVGGLLINVALLTFVGIVLYKQIDKIK